MFQHSTILTILDVDPEVFSSLLTNYRLVLQTPWALGGSARHHQTFFSLFFHILVRMTDPR
jgi:hypothetical protein